MQAMLHEALAIEHEDTVMEHKALKRGEGLKSEKWDLESKPWPKDMP